MNNNLLKRILTSLLLLILLSISLFINEFLWLILLIFVSVISLHEFNNLLKKIFKRKKKLNLHTQFLKQSIFCDIYIYRL